MEVIDTPTGASSGPRTYIGILWRRRAIVAVATIIAVGAMVVYLQKATRVYQATSALEITTEVSPTVLQAQNQTASVTAVDVPTAIQVIESGSVQSAVEKRVPGAPPVSASEVGTTNVVNLAVRSPDPRLAARAANAYAVAYTSTQRSAAIAALQGAIDAATQRLVKQRASIRTLQQEVAKATGAKASALQVQLGYLQESQLTLQSEVANYESATTLATGGGQIVSQAATPASPVKPKPAEYLILALIVGFILGSSVAIVRDRADDTIRNSDDLSRMVDEAALLGSVPLTAAGERRGSPRIVTRDNPQSVEAESYRILRDAIQFLQASTDAKVIQITSARAGDGKTTTLVNLAVTLAEAGKQVTVVDCDLRRPQLHRAFQLDFDPGLTSVLLGSVDIPDVVRRVDGLPGLGVIASGPLPPNPSELLQARRTRELIESLAHQSDIVLLDSPPLLSVADAGSLAQCVDAVLMVVGCGVSRRRDVATASALALRVNAPIRGFILNRVRDESGLYAGYYHAVAPSAES